MVVHDAIIGPSTYFSHVTISLFSLARSRTWSAALGDYAATVVREVGWPEVYLAFDDEADARKFAAAVEADVIGSHPGWASQRAFELDSAKLRELEASLPAPKSEKRRAPPDGSPFARRLRRGPWTPIKRYGEE